MPVSPAPSVTPEMLLETSWVPIAASCTFLAISSVVAVCSSTAEAMAAAVSSTSLMVLPMLPIASTASPATTEEIARNVQEAAALGEGARLEALIAGRRTVAEGVFSAEAVVALAGQLDVDMPISKAVDAILNRGAGIEETIEDVLARPFRAEFP